MMAFFVYSGKFSRAVCAPLRHRKLSRNRPQSASETCKNCDQYYSATTSEVS